MSFVKWQKKSNLHTNDPFYNGINRRSVIFVRRDKHKILTQKIDAVTNRNATAKQSTRAMPAGMENLEGARLG
jgi:hypothetical protein